MKTHGSIIAIAAAFGGYSLPAFAETDPWAILSAVEIEETLDGAVYQVAKTFPEELAAGITDFRITGYAIPMEVGDNVRQIMLVSDMGNCPFCGSGDHGVSLVVELDAPIPTFEEGTRISLRGDLEAVTDPETWQSAIMRRAQIVAN